MKQYLALFERTGDVDVVSDKIKDLKRQMDEEQRQLDEEQDKLNNLNASTHALATSSAEIKDLIEQLRGPTDDVFRLRAKVAERIRGLIEKIEFACIGAEPLFYLDDYDDNPVPPVLSDGSRWVHVYFKDGSRKVIIQKKTWDKAAEPEFEIIDVDLENLEVMRSLQPEELDKLAAQATLATK